MVYWHFPVSVALILFTLYRYSLFFRPALYISVFLVLSMALMFIHLLIRSLKDAPAFKLMACFLILCVGGVNDILFLAGMINTGAFGPYFFTAFVLLQSSIISAFAVAYRKATHSYQQLAKVSILTRLRLC